MNGRVSSAAWAGAAALVGFVVLAAGCTGSAERTPTVPTVNFAPKLVLSIDEQGFTWQSGTRTDSTLTVPAPGQPPTVPYGTVVEVVNAGRSPHWAVGGKVFDTGQMKPGERSVVVFAEDLTEPTKTIDIVDRDSPDHRTSIIQQVKPDGA